ncbi:sensor histidine kinase [Streptomyces sp. NPDC058653]|uniref:sensor histidine kinase n=1 Tax=Streptomyces sp. NPDC058653 TaxID=3346576 RepID=UPI00366515DB
MTNATTEPRGTHADADVGVRVSVGSDVGDGVRVGAEEDTGRSLTQLINRAAQRIDAHDRSHPLVWNLLLVSCLLIGGVVDVAGGGWQRVAPNPDAPLWLAAICVVAYPLPLLRRRTHPLEALLAMFPLALAQAWAGAGLQTTVFCELIAVFNIALRLPMRQLALSVALLNAPLVLGVARHPAEGWVIPLQSSLTSIAAVALLGIAWRTRQEYTASLRERAKQLEIERDQQAQLAAAAERTRIAREMHDILGHNLSVITGLADGGSYAGKKNPQRATEALDAIAVTSRQALMELRRLLGILQNETGPTTPAELAPQPGLGELDQLIDGVRAAGLPVDVTVTGDPGFGPGFGPGLGLDTAPKGRQLTIYRVVQEALTNTLKHAGPDATARVTLSRTREAITVDITDTGRPGPTNTGGRGITGMRERSALYAGTLEVGPLPAPDQGWRVHLYLPNDEDDRV